MKLDLKKIRLSLLSLCTFAGIMFVGLKGCDNGSSLSSETSRRALFQPLSKTPVVLHEQPVQPVRSARPYIPPEAKVTITPKDKTKTLDQIVDIKFKTYGLCFKPGIQVTVPFGVGIDAKLAFANKYGVGIAGIVGIRNQSQIHSFAVAAFASRHFERFDNLEAVAGIKFKVTGIDSPYVGLRLSF